MTKVEKPTRITPEQKRELELAKAPGSTNPLAGEVIRLNAKVAELTAERDILKKEVITLTEQLDKANQPIETPNSAEPVNLPSGAVGVKTLSNGYGSKPVQTKPAK